MREAAATSPMKAPVIRISIGKFDADKAVIVEEKLRESRAGLENGIRAMNGNIAYYVGIDRSNNAMHNVSFWETVADASQMACARSISSRMSVVGTFETCRLHRAMSEFEGKRKTYARTEFFSV
jgi:hypothetical protein